MLVAALVSGIVVFALAMVAASVGGKFYDARRRKQVSDMLQTAAGETVVPIANLLKDIDPDQPTGFKAIMAKLQFSRHAQEQIQQAGLNWSPTRLLTAMGLAMIPGGRGSDRPGADAVQYEGRRTNTSAPDRLRSVAGRQEPGDHGYREIATARFRCGRPLWHAVF